MMWGQLEATRPPEPVPPEEGDEQGLTLAALRTPEGSLFGDKPALVALCERLGVGMLVTLPEAVTTLALIVLAKREGIGLIDGEGQLIAVAVPTEFFEKQP